MGKHELLRRMARRASVNVSEKLPLTVFNEGEEVDISDGGTYFVRFRDVGGAAKDAILAAGLQETVEREVTQNAKGQFSSKEIVRRQREIRPSITAIVENGMVEDACFPVENAGETFQGWKWREDREENLAWLLDDTASYELMLWLVMKAFAFLAGPEEVVEELGESSPSTPTETATT